MKIFRSIEDYNLNQRTILTIGTFDGVHEGHKKILNKLMSTSKKKSLSSVVLTFFPHPRIILNKYNEVKMIDTLDEKIKAFEKLGIENLIIHPFDKNFSLLSADQFIKDYLIEKLKINHIIIGYDHRFGKGREASVDDLKKYGESFDFIVEEIKAHEVESIAVSSTKIRDAILNSNFEIAKKFLGRDYELNGVVIKGKGLGKTINFPTANLNIKEQYKLIPSKGVYLVRVYYNNNFFEGMMNIGNRPTIQGINQTQEVHIFNFNKNIYGEHLKVFFLKKIRDEKKFNSVEDLKNQLIRDKDTCKRNLSI